jgi:uncharacterized protein YaiE (UPF0345 family)
MVSSAAVAGTEEKAAASDVFPLQPPAMVREMVIVSHGNFKRVRELVDAHPSLAEGAIDWGFGDWENALGAASHTGNRDIAEYLIANGARPTLFSATMLGHLNVVKACIDAQTGVQRIPGPHSISLLAHANAGGKAAEAVRAYLESLGDAGVPATAPLTEDEMASLAGTYTFGSGPNDRIEITVVQGQLMFTRPGTMARGLYYVGSHAFHPAGASAVRIRFAAAGSGMALTVHDPDVVLTAVRA